MDILPISQKIYEKAISLGITEIHLIFEAGSNEPLLTIYLDGTHDAQCEQEMEQMIEKWALEAYDYSDDEDGNAYGDDVIYDLVNKTAVHEGWAMERTTTGGSEEELEITQETTQEAE